MVRPQGPFHFIEKRNLMERSLVLFLMRKFQHHIYKNEFSRACISIPVFAKKCIFAYIDFQNHCNPSPILVNVGVWYQIHVDSGKIHYFAQLSVTSSWTRCNFDITGGRVMNGLLTTWRYIISQTPEPNIACKNVLTDAQTSSHRPTSFELVAPFNR